MGSVSNLLSIRAKDPILLSTQIPWKRRFMVDQRFEDMERARFSPVGCVSGALTLILRACVVRIPHRHTEKKYGIGMHAAQSASCP